MELLKKNKIATYFCILAIAGLCAYVFQLMGGLGVTGMNNGTSWGSLHHHVHAVRRSVCGRAYRR